MPTESTNAERQNAESRWGSFIPRLRGMPADRTKVPVIRDVEALELLKYASRRGMSKGKVEALSRELHSDDPDPSAVAALYTDLVAETKPVNGHTLAQSRGDGFRRLSMISIVTGSFFLLAIGHQIVDSWTSDLVIDESPVLMNIKIYIWDYLTPFFWGGLGACVFLLKQMQDLAREQVYEHHYMQGWITRVLIGGILGAIVQLQFGPLFAQGSLAQLSSNTIAFLTGLGVKAVYGALERIIENIAKKVGSK